MLNRQHLIGNVFHENIHDDGNIATYQYYREIVLIDLDAPALFSYPQLTHTLP